jgi:hypothetical protein
MKNKLTRMQTKQLILLLVAFSIFSFTSQDKGNEFSTTRVLFMGNSLTYTNNLPVLVEKFAASKGIQIETEMLAYPNYSLEDHWKDGEIQKLIASKRFGFVVVQQGPSSQTDGKEMLIEYGSKLKNLCDRSTSRLMFFMVWPSKQNLHTFDGVINNYTETATRTKSLLCPVGKVWKDHFDSTNDYSYYGPDMFHPSLKGSEVAAEIIFDTLLKHEVKLER